MAWEFNIKYLRNASEAEEMLKLGCVFGVWHSGDLKRREFFGAAGGKCCSIFIWKIYVPFPMESPVLRGTITLPELPCKVHSSQYWFLTMSEVYQGTEEPKMSCSQQRNPHELLQDPLCLGTAGKTQNNCFGNDRGSSFLDFIFPKVIFPFSLMTSCLGMLYSQEQSQGSQEKLKAEWDVTASRAVCQAWRWVLRSSWGRYSSRERRLLAGWTKLQNAL